MDKVKRFFSFKTNNKLGIIIALIVLIIISAIMSPVFLNVSNLLNILKQNTMLGIGLIGMTMVILTGGIDLSVGSIVAFCGLITGYAQGLPTPLIFLLAIAMGLVIGCVNGYLVAYQNMEPFIVTLSTQISIRGLCIFLTGGSYISNITKFTWIGNGYIGIVPIPAIILIVMFIIFHLIASRMVYGKNVYAVGGGETAAKLSGINTRKVKMSAYVICGALCGVAAIINVARLNTAEPLAAEAMEVDAIAAALVGGNSLSGGRGSISGAFIGLLVFAVLGNIFNLIGLGSSQQQIVKGVIIIFAVLLSQKRKN